MSQLRYIFVLYTYVYVCVSVFSLTVAPTDAHAVYGDHSEERGRVDSDGSIGQCKRRVVGDNTGANTHSKPSD